MQNWIFELKSVVLVILICEFLKELLTGEKFKQYIQFAVTLFLFAFLLSTFFHTDFSLPELPEELTDKTYQSLLPQTYEEKIKSQLADTLSANQISYSDISVSLSENYELKSIRIETKESPETIQTLLKGDFPYEVVCPPEG